MESRPSSFAKRLAEIDALMRRLIFINQPARRSFPEPQRLTELSNLYGKPQARRDPSGK